MNKKTLTTLFITGLIVTMTSGCSSDEEYVFEHGPAGPNTKRTLESLPKGLQADKTKAHHTDDSLQPDQ